MAPKGANAKKEGGRAKKAENEAKKKDAASAAKEKQDADKWSDGAPQASKAKESKEEKRKAELARKAENARMLAEEEASAPKAAKPAPKAGAKKAASKPAGPGAIASGGGLAEVDTGKKEEPESFTATGLDNALDLLDVVTAKMDKASVGSKAAGLERHPERRFKAAFEAYKEREMPNTRIEHPGLRQQQYNDLLYKQFQKSPENPFNQVTVSYDASKDDKVDALKQRNAEIEARLREKS